MTGLVLFLGLLAGALYGSRELLGWLFHGVNPTVAAAVVAGATTTLVSVLSVVVGRYFERRYQIDLQLREKKIPIYTEFVEGILGIFATASDSPEPEPTDEVSSMSSDFVVRMSPKIMVWASNDVLTKWSIFRRSSTVKAPVDYMFMLEDLLAAIRSDLGHSGTELSKGTILGLYVNDIDDYVKKD